VRRRHSHSNGTDDEVNRRDRLGRGLGALLGEYLEQPPAEGEVTRLAVASIVPNPYQPRREFAEEELAELAESIRVNGLLQPLVVRAAGDDRWELIAGERRWRAITRLGWTQVPAVVRVADDRTMLVLALVENIQRAGLSPLDEAAGYQRLIEEFSFSHSDIAEATGRDRSTIANTVRLLQLPPSVRNLVGEGKLSAGHARALLGIGDERRIAELARQAAEEGWTVRQVEARVRAARSAKSAATSPTRRRPAARQRLEEALERALGTRVRIREGRGRGAGRIEITYHDPEELDRVVEILTGRTAGELVS